MGCFVSFVLFCLSQNFRARANLEAEKKFIEHNNKMEAIQLCQHMFIVYGDEIHWFIKCASSTFIRKKMSQLTTVKYVKNAQYDESVRDALFSGAMVKYGSDKDEAMAVIDAWHIFLQQLWPTKHEDRMTTTYIRALDYLSPNLSAEFRKSLLNGTWSNKFNTLFGQGLPRKKAELKYTLPVWLLSASITFLYLVSSMTFDYEPLKNAYNSWTDISFVLFWEIICVTASVWAQWFGQFFSPRFLIKGSFFRDARGLGLHSFLFGMFFVFMLVQNGRFRDFTTYVNSIVDVKYLGIASRIAKIHIPKFADYPELHGRAFGYNMNGKHWIHIFPSFLVPTFVLVLFKFKNIILHVYDKGIFVHGARFDSSIVRKTPTSTMNNTLSLVWQSYRGYPKIPAFMLDDLIRTFKCPKLWKIECNFDPIVPGITSMAITYNQYS